MWLLIALAFSIIFEIHANETNTETSRRIHHALGSNARKNCLETTCHLPMRDDFVYTKGIGAYKFHVDAKPWNAARKTCLEENAQLAIINSKKEEELLLKMINDNKNRIRQSNSTQWAHLGAQNLYDWNDWVTVTGLPLNSVGYEHWAVNEPEDGTKQHCLTLNAKGGLATNHCGTNYAFICELSLMCIFENN